MTKSKKAAAIEARIKRRLKVHLLSLGFRKNGRGELYPPRRSKSTLRRLHLSRRQELLRKYSSFVDTEWPSLREHFADGEEVEVGSIDPRLEQVVADTWQARLFRLAALSWSVPVTEGYGRRLRFLVWDRSNEKLIGLIGLCDPVFNLRGRDELIGWTADERRLRLVNSMSAFVLGAVPPYNMLLGGKLVACLVRSREVRDAFAFKYSKSYGQILRQSRPSALVLVTITSALGRSSVYNRLALGGREYFSSLGYTDGWGHFHISDELFQLFREYLEAMHDDYARNNRFGEGPNWRLRASRKALTLMGLNAGILRHGIRRELFACELAANAREYLRGEVAKPNFRGLLRAAQIGDLARARWMQARGERFPEYREWTRGAFLRLIEPSVRREARRKRVTR